MFYHGHMTILCDLGKEGRIVAASVAEVWCNKKIDSYPHRDSPFYDDGMHIEVLFLIDAASAWRRFGEGEAVTIEEQSPSPESLDETRLG